jgi:hypothetical protein
MKSSRIKVSDFETNPTNTDVGGQDWSRSNFPADLFFKLTAFPLVTMQNES